MAKNTNNNLEAVLKELDKTYGKGSVINGGELESYTDVISTGSVGLDAALGISGIPQGKIIEIYGWESSGKSTLVQTIIGNAQKKGIKCLYVDGENSLDETYAKSLGVNLNELLLIQLDEHGGEAAYNKAEKLINTGEIGLVVFDSQNSLQPKKLLEGEIGDATIGVHARMLGQAVMKMNAAAIKFNCTVIFISQLREKIGVMFGCLHADMPILFTDGRSLPIRKVVENRVKGKVWSWNQHSNVFEEKEIIDWHYNGDISDCKDYIHIETPGIEGNNRFGITVTPNHKLLTDKGWVEAKDINKTHRLASKYTCKNLFENDFIKGCLVGDSTISIRDKNTGTLKFQDSKNPDYIDWKLNILKDLNFKKSGDKYESEYSYELAKIKNWITKRDPSRIFENYEISWLSLAIWIMDDGNFQKSHERYVLSIKRFKYNNKILDYVTEMFERKDLDGKFNTQGAFIFTVESSKKIALNISKYIPKSMQYKLPEYLRGKNIEEINLDLKEVQNIEYVPVLSKRLASNRQMRQKGKYDISVEGNHNYLSGGKNNGVIVHNSPETTQGGNALKFYSHVRLDVRKSILKENDVAYANKTRVKVVKNKCAVPFKTAEFEIVFGQGIDTIQEIVELGHSNEILKKWGSIITYEENKYSINEFKETLKKDEKFFEEIRTKIISKLSQ